MTYNSHPWIMLFLIDCLSFGKVSSFEIGRPRSRGLKFFGRR